VKCDREGALLARGLETAPRAARELGFECAMHARAIRLLRDHHFERHARGCRADCAARDAGGQELAQLLGKQRAREVDADDLAHEARGAFGDVRGTARDVEQREAGSSGPSQRRASGVRSAKTDFSPEKMSTCLVKESRTVWS
jgi:hypothetical protein